MMASDIKYVYLNVTQQAFDIMKAMFKEGMSANAVQKLTSSLGLNEGQGYRRSTVQAVKRKALQMFKTEYAWSKLGDETLPNKTYFSDLDYKAPFRYWIHYDIEGVDSVTGISKQYTLSMFSDEILTKEQMKEEILIQLNPEYYANLTYFINPVIRSVDHKVGESY